MRVLLVEDEERLARAVKRALQQEGYQTDVAGDGASAVNLAQENPDYGAIILDILLPGMDGRQVCQVLRESGNSVPIIMLTALGEVADRVRGLDLGADDYLMKPFALEELLARLRALHRRKTDKVDLPVLKVADLELDSTRRRVRRGEEPIELTATEFRLLEFLMRSPGQVFTRTQLLERVWGYNFDGEVGVVDTYVHYLRSKIDRPHAPSLIRTARGVGYSLDGP